MHRVRSLQDAGGRGGVVQPYGRGFRGQQNQACLLTAQAPTHDRMLDHHTGTDRHTHSRTPWAQGQRRGQWQGWLHWSAPTCLAARVAPERRWGAGSRSPGGSGTPPGLSAPAGLPGPLRREGSLWDDKGLHQHGLWAGRPESKRGIQERGMSAEGVKRGRQGQGFSGHFEHGIEHKTWQHQATSLHAQAGRDQTALIHAQVRPTKPPDAMTHMQSPVPSQPSQQAAAGKTRFHQRTDAAGMDVACMKAA